jgi:hypothetical protein
MSYSRLLPAALTVAVLITGAASADAGQGRAAGRGVATRGAVAVGRPAIGVTGGVRVGGVFRPYYYPGFRPGFGFGFGFYGYPYGWGYPYGYYGYPYGYYDPYYAAPPAGYVQPGSVAGYGSVRIEDAPRDGQVFADGYYVGIVSDFNGPVRHLDLPAGAHRIEVRVPGVPPSAVDVKVEPGQTITFHASVH